MKMLSPVQRKGNDGADTASVHEAASAGVAGSGGKLPHADRIQAAFGRHDVSGIQAHTGTNAAKASAAMGAEAYATGDNIAFGRGAPDLHTAAHEAAHVVQQKAGVSLAGGVGETGDAYEQHADRVADKVVRGESAEGELDKMAGGGTRSTAVQKKNLTQAGQSTGLTDKGSRQLVDEGFAGKLFSATGSKATGRTEALTEAGRQNANIGQRTSAFAWTKDATKLNSDTELTLDPFSVQIEVPFTKDSKDENLTLLYQHASRWTGYVTQIEDSSNTATTGGVTMFNKFDTHTAKKSSDKYSNVHGDTKGTEIASLTDGSDEQSLDAYTKIAGESARWICVRNHATKLCDTSRFFIPHIDPTLAPTKVLGVDFRTLWLSWKNAFNKAYDIPDATVTTALKNGGGLAASRVPIDKSTLNTNDYDLVAGKAYTPTVVMPSTKGDTK